MQNTTPSAANVRRFVGELDDRVSGPAVRSTPSYEDLDMLIQVAVRLEKLEELESLVRRMKLSSGE